MSKQGYDVRIGNCDQCKNKTYLAEFKGGGLIFSLCDDCLARASFHIKNGWCGQCKGKGMVAEFRLGKMGLRLCQACINDGRERIALKKHLIEEADEMEGDRHQS